MSEIPNSKDARGILNLAGRSALRAAALNVSPLAEDTPDLKPYPVTRADEMSGVVEAADFVEGLLTEGGASVVYGPSNTGKSFWVLDLAVSVATGNRFRDEMEVDPGAVVYLALEGSHGVRNRIAALKKMGKLPEMAPFFLCFAQMSLLAPHDAARMADTVKAVARQCSLPCRLIIVDTLARGMAGGDENSGQDMTRAVQAVDLIRAETSAHVLIVHHSGKDEARGARGHSSLRAAVDTEIEVSRSEGESISTVRVTKQRDIPPGEPMPFSLRVVELGVDRRGKPITSCVVHHEDPIMAGNRPRPGRKPEVDPLVLLNHLPASSTSAWRKAAADENGITKSSFYRAVEKLKSRGEVVQDSSKGWKRAEPSRFEGFPAVP